MAKVVLFLFLVSAVAQTLPSCGDSGTTSVIGWVEAKRVELLNGVFLITINSTEYDVPGPFWRDVRVGDLVKWDGVVWTIVRRASQ